MSDFIKIRNNGDLWWSEVLLSEAYGWQQFEILYLGPENCFVMVNGNKLEMSLDSYKNIMDNKAFKIKFGLKKHNFEF
jgi:hypothetical protein